MKTVVGYYNEQGYRIVLDEEEVYNSGNSSLGSQAHVPQNEGLIKATIQGFCKRTAQEMAQEFNATFMGVEYEPLEMEG